MLTVQLRNAEKEALNSIEWSTAWLISSCFHSIIVALQSHNVQKRLEIAILVLKWHVSCGIT